MSDHNAKQDTACGNCNGTGFVILHNKQFPCACQSLSQSAERMTADDFAQQMVDCLSNLPRAMIGEKLRDFFAERLKAYAEHCTAALRAELRVAIEDGDADFWKARAESSAALVRELAQALSLGANILTTIRSTDKIDCSGWIDKAESLLSDPAVKKVLEK